MKTSQRACWIFYVSGISEMPNWSEKMLFKLYKEISTVATEWFFCWMSIYKFSLGIISFLLVISPELLCVFATKRGDVGDQPRCLNFRSVWFKLVIACWNVVIAQPCSWLGGTQFCTKCEVSEMFCGQSVDNPLPSGCLGITGEVCIKNVFGCYQTVCVSLLHPILFFNHCIMSLRTQGILAYVSWTI